MKKSSPINSETILYAVIILLFIIILWNMMTKNTKEHFVNPSPYICCPRGSTLTNDGKTCTNKKSPTKCCTYGYSVAYNPSNPSGYCARQSWYTGS
jgi:hypothetical protein